MTGIGGAPADQEDPRADLIWGTVPTLVEDAAVRHGATEALVDGRFASRTRSWRPRSIATPAASSRPASDAKDRVALWAPNCAEWMLAALGLLRAGAVLVPLNTRFKGGEAAYILRTSGATTLLTVRGFLGTDYPAMLAGRGHRRARAHRAPEGRGRRAALVRLPASAWRRSSRPARRSIPRPPQPGPRRSSPTTRPT